MPCAICTAAEDAESPVKQGCAAVQESLLYIASLPAFLLLASVMFIVICRPFGVSMDDDEVEDGRRHAVAFAFGSSHAWEQFTVLSSDMAVVLITG